MGDRWVVARQTPEGMDLGRDYVALSGSDQTQFGVGLSSQWTYWDGLSGVYSPSEHWTQLRSEFCTFSQML